MQKSSTAQTLAILGSGLMLETPLDLVPDHITEIHLIDAVHTKQVRKTLQMHPRAGHLRWHEIDFNRNPKLQKFDILVSANLLSQIPLKADPRSQKTRKDWQMQHLDFCQAHAQKGLIFSDFRMIVKDLAGQVQKTQVTVDLDLPWSQKWIWNLAPAPEISKEYSIELEVGCFSKEA